MDQREATPRGTFGLIADPRFGRYFLGKAVSSLGSWVYNIVAVIVMWDLTGSTVMVGAVSVMQFMGPLLLAPLTGLLTDILDRRLLLLWGRLLSSAGAGAIALSAAAGTLVPAHLLVATAVVGVGFAISAPSQQALIPALVPAVDLRQAVTMNSSVGSLSRAIGPALGGAILVTGGPAVSFAAAAVAHGLFAALLVRLTPRAAAGWSSETRIFDGLRYVCRDWRMGLLLVGLAALGFGADPMITLTPALADELGAGESGVGWMASAFGGGALATVLLLPTLRRWTNLRIQGVVGFGMLGAGMAIVAVSPLYAGALAGFAVAGAGFVSASSALTTRVQQRVPDELRGRVMAVWTVAFLGSRPLAAGVNGVVAEIASVRAAVTLAAVVAFSAMLLARVSYREVGQREAS